jgi:bidirectional [NiFe] hydrogenase diaphorase subunit
MESNCLGFVEAEKRSSTNMIAAPKQQQMPSADKRWRIVDATMRRHGYVGNCLIETLHTAQESFGFLDEPALRFVAGSLNLPLSKVYGVATFYHHFMLKPQGKHTCVVCLGTACYIKGATELLVALENKYGVKTGQTTRDGQLSILTARCLGSCGLAPAVVLDGAVIGKTGSGDLLNRVGEKVNHDAR